MNKTQPLWKRFLAWLFGEKEAQPIPKPRIKPQKKPRPKLCPVTEKLQRTEKGAKLAAKRLSVKQRPIRAYKCEYCPAWHLTHKSNHLTMH